MCPVLFFFSFGMFAVKDDAVLRSPFQVFLERDRHKSPKSLLQSLGSC